MAEMSVFSAFADQNRPLIEAALGRFMEKSVEGCTPVLQEAMRYSLLSPGKRIRPLLTLMAAEACGGDPALAMPAACAVEMVHAFSLIHDDLPAMDDDDLRRGKPTSHKVFGEGEAILAGDALFALPFQILAEEVHPAETAAQCCAALARASGACGMIGGQWDDIRNHPDTLSVARRKTGALIEVSLHLGALTVGGSAKQIVALKEFGWRAGVVFQLVDDLLDGEGGEDSRARAKTLTNEALHFLDLFSFRAESLRSFAGKALDRTK